MCMGLRTLATKTSVPKPKLSYICTISSTIAIPSCPTSSKRPTNGDTMVAPAFATNKACTGEKTKVTLVRMPSAVSFFTATMPFSVIGIFTTTLLANFASSLPSETIWSISSPITSAETGPLTSLQIDLITSKKGFPDFAIRDGLVVTPSTQPRKLAALISSISAESIKNFISFSFCAVKDLFLERKIRSFASVHLILLVHSDFVQARDAHNHPRLQLRNEASAHHCEAVGAAESKAEAAAPSDHKKEANNGHAFEALAKAHHLFFAKLGRVQLHSRLFQTSQPNKFPN